MFKGVALKKKRTMLKNKSRRYVNQLFFLLLIAIPTISPAQTTSVVIPQFKHEQKFTFSGKGSIPVEILIDNPAEMAEVRCYFRFAEGTPYYFTEMKQKDANAFITRLPEPSKKVSVIEYLFLFVNDKRQLLVTDTFTMKRQVSHSRGDGQDQIESAINQKIQSDIQNFTANKDLFSLSNDIRVEQVSRTKRYGTLAGLYPKEQLSGVVAEGYFGAFLIHKKEGITPIKGSIIIKDDTDASLVSRARSTSADEAAVTRIEPVDISGSNWNGEFWTSDNYAGTVQSLSATISQDSEGKIIITTDLEGVGGHFIGDIYEDAHMMLYDQYDNEDWTTYFGPVEELSVIIADFVRPPSMEEPSPPLHIIELSRKYKSITPHGAMHLLLQ